MIGKLLLRRRGNMVRPLVTETGALVQCNPVPDSVLGIKSYFSPVETPPAEGDKSPTNPSTISGWESVEVTRCGKNLLRNRPVGTANYAGLTITGNADGTTVINGTSTAIIRLRYYFTPSESYITTDDKVATLSVNNDKIIPEVSFYVANLKTNASFLNSSFTDINQYKTGKIWQPIISGTLASSAGVNYNNLSIRPQLEIGSAPTEYEKYNGNTYTATFPSEIGGGYVDWERGVLVETHRKLVFDGTEDWSSVGTNYSILASPEPADADSVTHDSHSGLWSEKDYNFVIQPNGCSQEGCTSLILLNGKTAFTTVFDFKTFLANENTAGTPVTVVYKLKTPIETPISDLSPIYAIDGINTIYSNAGDVEVTYKGAR